MLQTSMKSVDRNFGLYFFDERGGVVAARRD
jgi:hypothetical protein